MHHYSPHDAERPWGADEVPAVVEGVRAALAVPTARVADLSANLADPTAPDDLVSAAVAEFGRLDILVCNQARSGSDGPLSTMTAEMLDAPDVFLAKVEAAVADALACAEATRRHARGTQRGPAVPAVHGQRAVLRAARQAPAIQFIHPTEPGATTPRGDTAAVAQEFIDLRQKRTVRELEKFTQSLVPVAERPRYPAPGVGATERGARARHPGVDSEPPRRVGG